MIGILFHSTDSFSILNEYILFVFDCSFSLWYNPLDFRSAMKPETGMLLEDLKLELNAVKNRIETLRRHL